jgi:Ca-activated chloride channel family protein
MSFADPLWLLALALIPLVIVLQLLLRRRARRYAVRFTAVATLREAVELGGSWRRWLPAALLLAALGVGVAALARPQVTRRVPIRDGSLMLVIDHSGSMVSDDVKPSRLAAAIRAANKFIDQVPSSIKLGAIGFSNAPDAVQRPVVAHAAARSLIDTQQAGGGTATGPALQLALQLLGAGSTHHPPEAIVLLSDGAANLGVNPVTVAAQAHQDHVPIYTVALGTPNGVITVNPFTPPVAVPPDPQLMQQIARTSGGRSFDAQTAGDLSSIYQNLGRRLSTVGHKHDITVYWLLAAVALVLFAAGASVRTVARVP